MILNEKRNAVLLYRNC